MAACGHGFAGTPVAHCGNVYPETAAAGLWSTPADLARLGIELSESLEGRSISVLNQATAELMLTKGRDDMGLGVGVHGEGDGLHFDHAGWNRGSRASTVVYPLAGKGIVVLAHADARHALTAELLSIPARTYHSPRPPPPPT